MKKIVCLLAGLLALALFAGCSADDSSGGGINTGQVNGSYNAASAVSTVEEEGATVTANFSSTGNSYVSWIGNEYTLYIQMITKVDCNTHGHSHTSNDSPVLCSLTKNGTQFYYKDKAISVTGDPALGNFTINGELTLKQAGLLLTPEVTIKFTDLSFKKN